MKRKSVKILAVLALCASMFTGCSRYVSSYSATLLIQSHTSSYASVSFGSIKGTISYRLKSTEDADKLEYSASLEKGSATVYIDTDGTKREFFRISAGENVASTLDVDKGEIYIIIETDETCEDGSMDFNIVQ